MKLPEQKFCGYVSSSLSEIPWAIQHINLHKYGARKWTKQEINEAKAEYLETRDEGDRIHDKKLGIEEWLMS